MLRFLFFQVCVTLNNNSFSIAHAFFLQEKEQDKEVHAIKVDFTCFISSDLEVLFPLSITTETTELQYFHLITVPFNIKKKHVVSDVQDSTRQVLLIDQHHYFLMWNISGAIPGWSKKTEEDPSPC